MVLSDKMTEKAEKVQGKIQDNVRELPEQTRRMLGETSDRIAKYYDTSAEFVRENQAIVLITAGLVLGLTGFFIGRASKNEL